MVAAMRARVWGVVVWLFERSPWMTVGVFAWAERHHEEALS